MLYRLAEEQAERLKSELGVIAAQKFDPDSNMVSVESAPVESFADGLWGQVGLSGDVFDDIRRLCPRENVPSVLVVSYFSSSVDCLSRQFWLFVGCSSTHSMQ